MSKEPWQKVIQGSLAPGETYESAERYYTDIDPDVQNILDAKRLMKIDGDEEIRAGAQRLRDAVVNILDGSDATNHPGYLHAIGELGAVGIFFSKDPKVKELIKKYSR